MKNTPMKINGIEFVVNGEIRVSSVEVAERFSKRHTDVMRAINNLECSSSFVERNFALTSYKDKSSRTQSSYAMTRDGFSFLAMGFTGKDAAVWKEKYIEAFNAMEKYIIEEQARKASDNAARLENPAMTKALMEMRQVAGKETRHFHYSKENNLVYKIALGATKKKYCQALDIPMEGRFRDHLSALEIRIVEEIQRANTTLIEMGMEYQDRKTCLEALWKHKFAALVKDDVDRLEA